MLGHINIKRISIGALIGILSTAVLLFFSAVILYFTPAPDTMIEFVSVISAILGLLSGGVASAIKAEGHGWISGGISGVFYIVILCVISVLVLGNPGIIKLLITLVIGFVIGATGGITGINLKTKSRRKKRGRHQIL